MFRTTPALPAAQAADRGPTVETHAAGKRARPVTYERFLTWRGSLERDATRRPAPDPPAAPPAHRNAAWKYAFVGSRCQACGTMSLPPQRVCYRCNSVDDVVPAPAASLCGRVAAFTVDRLAYSPSPPLVAAVVDFDGGGRFLSEVADADPDELVIGAGVSMTFRRLYEQQGIDNYFWKARIEAKEARRP